MIESAQISPDTTQKMTTSGNDASESSNQFVDPKEFNIVIKGKTVKGKIISTFAAEIDPNYDKKYDEMCKSLDEPDNEFCSFIVFDDESIPAFHITNTRSLPVINLGDLDGDNSDELAILPEFRPFDAADYRRVYIVESLKKSGDTEEWIELLPYLDTDVRAPFYLPAQKIAQKPGWVTVQYIDVTENLEEAMTNRDEENPKFDMVIKEIEISKASDSDIKSKIY